MLAANVSAGAPSAQALLALGLTAEQVAALTQLLSAQQQQQQQTASAVASAGQQPSAATPAAPGGAASDAVALLLPLLASLAQKHISATAAGEQQLAQAQAQAQQAVGSPANASSVGVTVSPGTTDAAADIAAPSDATAATAAPTASETAAATATATAAAAAEPSSSDVDLDRFVRMLRMGVPPPAVQHKMRGEGVDPARHWDALMRKMNGGDAFPATGSPAAGSAASSGEAGASPATDTGSAATPAEGASPASAAAAGESAAPVAAAAEPAGAAHGLPADVLAKFERMLKMGIPPAAVQHKMRGDGIADVPAALALLELCKRLGKPMDGIQLPEGMPGAGAGDAAGASAGGGSDADSAAKAEWAARKAARKAAADAAAAEQAAAAAEAAASQEREAAEARALEEERRRRIAELLQEQLDVAAELSAPLKDTKRYGPFFYMRRVGVPPAVIEHKMVMAGLDPSILRQDESLPLQGVSVVPLREDMAYSRYFAMARMGVPRDAVLHKMRGDGANALALELNPDLPAPPGLADLAAGLVLSPHTRQQIAAQYAQAAAQSGAAAARPRRQRKKLHWEVRGIGAGKQTIWGGGAGAGDDASGGGGGSGGLDSLIDDAELAALFTQDATASRTGAAGGGKGSGKGDAGSSSAKVIYLLDMKRGRNVGIGIRKIKMPPEALRRCLLGLTRGVDGFALSLEELTLLEELLPSPEEATLVRAFRGDRTRLGEAERFFLAVADVQKPRARAGALAFQQTFDAADAALAASVATVVSACEQLRTSQRLRRVLEAALLIGNRLNTADDEELMGGSSPSPGAAGAADGAASPAPSSHRSTPSSSSSAASAGGIARGGAGSGSAAAARAIAVSSLLKLGQTKAYTSSRLTLLHYVAARLRRVSSDPATMAVAEELPSLPAAARLSVELLRADLAALKSGLSSVEALVREQVRHDAHAAAAVASASARARAGSTLLLGSSAGTAAGAGAGSAIGLSGRGASASVSEPSDGTVGGGAISPAGSVAAPSAAIAAAASGAAGGGSPTTARRASRASMTAGGPGTPSSGRGAAAGGAGAGAGLGGAAPRVRLGSYLEEVTGLGAAVDEALAGTDVSTAASSASSGAGFSTGPALAPAAQHENLGDFVARAQSRLAALAAAVDGAASTFASTLDFFGEEPGSMSVESFCGTLHAFVAAFQRADADNLADEARKAREARRGAPAIAGNAKAGATVANPSVAHLALAAADSSTARTSPTPTTGAAEATPPVPSLAPDKTLSEVVRTGTSPRIELPQPVKSPASPADARAALMAALAARKADA